jgi:hypothetical protein
MKPLPAALDDYLALRRSLGYKLCDEGAAFSGNSWHSPARGRPSLSARTSP